MATIVDDRKPGWCWIDNDVIDKYGPSIGPHAIAVYLVLARYANKDTRKAWPSFATIAKLSGISRPTAIKAISKLIDSGLVATEKRTSGYGDWDSNSYTLLPVNVQGDLLGGKSGLPPSKPDLPGVVNDVYQGSKGGLLEQYSVNKTYLEQESTLTADAVSAPVEKPAKAKTTVRAPKVPPPAEIELIRSITNRYPDKALWDQLVVSLSGKNPETVKAAYTAWIARGFRPTNYAWALEWVPNGIPAAPGRNVPNGRATPNGLPSPEMVWGIVQAEIDRVHYSGTPNLPAPILAAVEAVGGWYAVCKSDPAGAIPARLRDAYRAALSA